MKISKQEYKELLAAKEDLEVLKAEQAARDRLAEAQRKQHDIATRMIIAATRNAPGGPFPPACGLYPF